MQDYLSIYEDLRQNWPPKGPEGEKTDITDDVVFEVELVKQIEVNIDYILMLVKQYHDGNCEDKEILVTIQKAVDSSPTLRSKKKLIEAFIGDVNDSDGNDIIGDWNDFVFEKREEELGDIIKAESLSLKLHATFLKTHFNRVKSRLPVRILIA